MIKIFQDVKGEHRFRVSGDNGEPIVTSEGYTRPEDARRGLETLRRVLADTLGDEVVVESDPE